MHHKQEEEIAQCYGCGNVKMDQKVGWLSLASMKDQFCLIRDSFDLPKNAASSLTSSAELSSLTIFSS